MSVVPLRLYQGLELSEPEILLLQYIEQEREKIRLTEFEKLQQRKFLATKVGEVSKAPPKLGDTGFEITPTKKIADTSFGEKKKATGDLESSAKKVHPTLKSLEMPTEEDQDEDQANQFTIEKDESLPATKIKKRDRSEMEEEDNIPVSQYFHDAGLVLNEIWDSMLAGSNKEVYLPNFSIENTNTIGIRLDTQQTSGWAFNLCPAEDPYLVDVLFHFNPRYKTKDRPTIVMNDRVGTWGDGAKEEMRHPRGILANTVELKVELRPEGFLVYANGIYAAFFPHRRDIHQFKDLKIIFIAKDDNGKSQEVKINQVSFVDCHVLKSFLGSYYPFSFYSFRKVWWGHVDFKREVLPPSINNIIQKASKVVYESVANPMAPRTIIAEGLPKLEDLEELQGLEYSMLDLFEPYQVKRVSLVTGAGIAFIKVFEVFFF
jgi:hypothetical protein